MPELKICKECLEEKEIEDFYFRKTLGRYENKCKNCIKISNNKRKIIWRKNNRERQLQMQRKYYLDNKERLLGLAKIKSDKRWNEIKTYYKSYRKKNYERRKELNRNYIIKNKDHYDKMQRDYRRNRAKVDIAYNILMKLRSRIYHATREKGNIKSGKTEELLGCSIPFFKDYIKSLFTDGMTYEFLLEGKIHIDHRIPCNVFDLSNENEQRKCFHYTNLQPLWAKHNLMKGCKVNFTFPIKHNQIELKSNVA